MLIEKIDKRIYLNQLKDELKKIGTNFVTAGTVGVFINHYTGYGVSNMLWASVSITLIGAFILYLGLKRRKK